MTLDKAIERYTSNAEYERTHGNLQGCLDFRQLAEWLKDYKRLLKQEPKIGHWINIDATHSKCDRCEAVFEIVSENGEVNYCPNCGAKMVEPQEGSGEE